MARKKVVEEEAAVEEIVPTPEEQAVADAAAVVAEAAATHAEAEAALAEAKADHAAAVKAAEPQPVVGKHILVDSGATGDYALRDVPAGWANDRSLRIDGVNVEHVGDLETAEGLIWKYRKM